METIRPSITKPAMTYGLIIALVMIILAVIVWIGSLETAGWFQWVNWAAYLGVLYYCLKRWRDEHLGGFIRYGQAVKAGTLFMFFASIVYSFYFVIYSTWLDPEYVAKILDGIEESYYKSGFSEDVIEQALVWAEKIRQPGFMFFSSIFGTTITGFILSLIISFFVKKEGDPYRQAMSEIEKTSEE
jgi:drug/metabolite transporter (DMT)-like permease